MPYRKRPQRLQPTAARGVFDAVLACRRQVLIASTEVPRFGPVDRSLAMIVAAIDALCVYLRCLDSELWEMDSEFGEAVCAPERSNRPDVIESPWLLLGDLRTCRDELLRALPTVAAQGATAQALAMVLAAISATATLLTGNRDYFHEAGAGATAGEVGYHMRKLARESGEPSD
ncbi:hypothetical protein ACNHKD_12695 [Methylocystis sp. JAN1]|uniref:hypothetical protein n=1 Tax=Methylocystis sp. JAN1 TaxID=3397211 RepID=UPI003FA2111D